MNIGGVSLRVVKRTEPRLWKRFLANFLSYGLFSYLLGMLILPPPYTVERLLRPVGMVGWLTFWFTIGEKKCLGIDLRSDSSEPSPEERWAVRAWALSACFAILVFGFLRAVAPKWLGW